MNSTRRAVLAGLLATGIAPCTAGSAVAARPRPAASLLGKEIRRLPTSRHEVALTFNAAWDESGLDTVLTELRRRRLPATFFPTGRFARAHPRAVRAMGAEHGLGNHSDTHPYFDRLTSGQREQEVRRADAAIREAARTEPLPFFRFPFSHTTPETVADVNRFGYAAIEFTVDTNGYLGPGGGMTVERVVGRAVAALAPGALIQMHVGSATGGTVLDAEALPHILDAVRANGYGVVDLRAFLVPEGT
ncbi:polysaccharide deacetylase family protein [Streptomyces sp. BG9H]|uniref:Polysaccharide deacetylase family protein n=1 Tax=Streptomyces anatolicus TaxID=2675858 RepID=A0ABS6YUJ4_9ACTN|nr:polysaccharide deacetylase family protein [Streptomyces anatolicus]